MTKPVSRDNSPVIDQLHSEGYRFGFFQAVRLLERWRNEAAPVGRDSVPAQEVVRFGTRVSSEFPASQIHEVAVSEEQAPTRMTVAFMGLAGSLGALPQHYTEMIQQRIAVKDRTLIDFLNLFNHRLISLFYRSWEKYQYWIQAERTIIRERQAADSGPEQRRAFVLHERPQLDPMGEMLLSLTGLASPALRYVLPHRDHLEPRTEISDQTWRFYAGVLAQQHRPAVNLEAILSDHFGWPVRIQSLCGRWLQLEQADRTCLRPGGNTRLGMETVAGSKVWEVQGKFRIQLGPLSYEQFCGLLPIGAAHRPLVQFTRYYAGMHLDFDLELQLRSEEIPPLRCGDKTGIGPRLGWNTWLRSGQARVEPAVVALRPYDDEP